MDFRRILLLSWHSLQRALSLPLKSYLACQPHLQRAAEEPLLGTGRGDRAPQSPPGLGPSVAQAVQAHCERQHGVSWGAPDLAQPV